MHATWAPYMFWSKTRPAVRYDLAISNLLGCTLEDLPGGKDALELNGLNPEGYPPLVEAIAARYGSTPDRVATAPGAAGANFLALAALVRPGDEVLLERPAYDPLLGALRLLGARVRRFDRLREEDWSVDPKRVRTALTKQTRLIVLTSPHNPTGALIPTTTLEEVGRIAERNGAHVLVDEVYLDAVYDDRPAPAATLGDVFVTTNSLTKSYGLAGLRCGWVIGSPGVAEAVRRVRDVVDGNSVFAADRLAVLAFQRLAALEERARRILQPNLALLTAWLQERTGLDWVRPSGGTIAFVGMRGVTDTRSFAEALRRERDTAVVPGFFFDAPGYMRIAFGGSNETLVGGLAALGEAISARAGI